MLCRMSNHYDTLGVAKGATAKEIRKAYLRRARALHPDRQQGRSPADARRAEEAMQQVNVAWNVLSDTKKRSEYDEKLSPKSSGSRQTGQQRPAATHRVNNPPPRTPPPTTSRPTSGAGRSIDDEPGDGSVSVWASLPVLIIVGIALGILIVTAFGNNNDDGGSDNRPVAPDLDAQMLSDDCFIFVGTAIQQVSCATGRADGRVVDIVPDPGNCPANTENTTQGDLVLCFERLIPGSVNPVSE